MATLSAHNERRAEYMLRRTNRLQGVPASAADRHGIVKVSLREPQQHELRLLPPADDFWPFEDYVKKHGDPSKFKERRGLMRTVARRRCGGAGQPAAAPGNFAVHSRHQCWGAC